MRKKEGNSQSMRNLSIKQIKTQGKARSSESNFSQKIDSLFSNTKQKDPTKPAAVDSILNAKQKNKNLQKVLTTPQTKKINESPKQATPTKTSSNISPLKTENLKEKSKTELLKFSFESSTDSTDIELDYELPKIRVNVGTQTDPELQRRKLKIETNFIGEAKEKSTRSFQIVNFPHEFVRIQAMTKMKNIENSFFPLQNPFERKPRSRKTRFAESSLNEESVNSFFGEDFVEINEEEDYKSDDSRSSDSITSDEPTLIFPGDSSGEISNIFQEEVKVKDCKSYQDERFQGKIQEKAFTFKISEDVSISPKPKLQISSPTTGF